MHKLLINLILKLYQTRISLLKQVQPSELKTEGTPSIKQTTEPALSNKQQLRQGILDKKAAAKADAEKTLLGGYVKLL